MIARPKILLAPMNFAMMPQIIAEKLRARGYEAEHLHYAKSDGHPFGFTIDNCVNVEKYESLGAAHTSTLADCLNKDFDIFHFWNKSLVHDANYTRLNGFDLPLIKLRGKKIIHRFTGFDLRLKSWDMAVNPHSPYRYGYDYGVDFEEKEKIQIAYIELLKQYADELLVQDPEMQQFLPEAKIIPRALNLAEWPCVGVEKTQRPLVVHAPSNSEVKGTKFILQAIEELQAEGLSFEFKLLERIDHDEVRQWLKRSDIVIDQILIGATGVLTLEAWALGKPVILNLREDLFGPFYETDDLPVANANPDTIKDVIKNLVKDFDWRLKLSNGGRRIVEKYHDIEKVIDQFVDLYDGLHGRPAKPVTGTADIEHLNLQLDFGLAGLKEQNVKMKQYNSDLRSTRDTLKETIKTLRTTRDDLREKVAALESKLSRWVSRI